MNAIRAVLLITALCASSAQAQVPSAVEPGDRFEIVRSYRNYEKTNGTDSGNSSGHDTLVERIVALRDGGVELEYDVPTGEERREWQFPVRVFKPASGPMLLLNEAELAARVDPWLAKANWTREICGQWIFTWSAFKIECDPQSALDSVSGFSLWQDDLRAGAPFTIEYMFGSPHFELVTADANGSSYVVTVNLDPDQLRLRQAGRDVVVGQILGKPITQEEALKKYASEQFSGTVTVRFAVTASGLVIRRTDQFETRTVKANGDIETHKGTTIIERRRIN